MFPNKYNRKTICISRPSARGPREKTRLTVHRSPCMGLGLTSQAKREHHMKHFPIGLTLSQPPTFFNCQLQVLNLSSQLQCSCGITLDFIIKSGIPTNNVSNKTRKFRDDSFVIIKNFRKTKN